MSLGVDRYEETETKRITQEDMDEEVKNYMVKRSAQITEIISKRTNMTRKERNEIRVKRSRYVLAQRKLGRTLKDIAKELGVTPVRISQIEAWIKEYNRFYP